MSAIMKSFVFFLGKVILFLHLRGRENSRKLQQCMQTQDFVSGLHNCLEFSQHLSCLYQAMQTRKMFSIA